MSCFAVAVAITTRSSYVCNARWEPLACLFCNRDAIRLASPSAPTQEIYGTGTGTVPYAVYDRTTLPVKNRFCALFLNHVDRPVSCHQLIRFPRFALFLSMIGSSSLADCHHCIVVQHVLLCDTLTHVWLFFIILRVLRTIANIYIYT